MTCLENHGVDGEEDENEDEDEHEVEDENMLNRMCRHEQDSYLNTMMTRVLTENEKFYT